MKKTTKRLTMIVAILLCLVLITSSVVSTTLAKFVISKSSTSTIKLEKFGVEVTFTGLGNVVKKGDSVIYTTSTNLSMKPGDFKAIEATIKGKPTVPATITIDVAVSYTDTDYKILKNNAFTDVTEDTVYFPIGFKVGGSSGTEVVTPYSNKSGATISNDIEAQISSRLSALTLTKSNNALTQASWGTGGTETASLNSPVDIGLYMYWPKDYNSGKTDPIFDEVGTFLAKNNPTFKVIYTISITQN